MPRETRAQLEDLINRKLEEMNQAIGRLNNAYNQNVELYEKLKEKVEVIEQASLAITEEGGTNQQIEDIGEAHNKIVLGKDEQPALKDHIEEVAKKSSEAYGKIQGIENSVLGHTTTDDSSKKKYVPGIKKKLDTFYDGQKVRYQELYNRIEQELAGGATSANLALTFTNKAKEYQKNEWSRYFVVYLCFMIIVIPSMFIGLLALLKIKLGLDWSNILLFYPLISISILGFSIWLGVFLSHGRAENKKLEEMYKHKEAMARSFVGYRETIKNLGEEDKELLRNHMVGLLEAITRDPSDILPSRGDEHPIQTFWGRKKEKIQPSVDKSLTRES